MICYICGSPCKSDVLHGGYKYWKCQKCFTSQVLPQPSQEDLKSYYDAYHLSDQDGGVYDEIENRMRADFSAKIKLVFKYANSQNCSLLDVGCGKGYFVKSAVDSGILAEGIDLSKSGVKHAVEVLGVKATEGKIDELESTGWLGNFDVVTFWATIEHLSDPRDTLLSISKCLKPGGVLICDTGLGNALCEKFLPGHSQWFDAPQHLFVFSEIGLIRLIEQAGFEVVFVDNNFDRSLLRRHIRWLRHVTICIGAYLFPGLLLGQSGFLKMKQEAKWPIGRLISVVARKL